jgi:hypothetical protein
MNSLLILINCPIPCIAFTRKHPQRAHLIFRGMWWCIWNTCNTSPAVISSVVHIRILDKCFVRGYGTYDFCIIYNRIHNISSCVMEFEEGNNSCMIIIIYLIYPLLLNIFFIPLRFIVIFSLLFYRVRISIYTAGCGHFDMVCVIRHTLGRSLWRHTSSYKAGCGHFDIMFVISHTLGRAYWWHISSYTVGCGHFI